MRIESGRSRVLISVSLVLALLLVMACSSSAPEKQAAPKAVATTEAAPEVVAKVLATPVAGVVPEAAARAVVTRFPLTPDWVSQGKYTSMVLKIVGRSSPGETDLHRCSSTLSCQRLFSPRFNQLVEYDPVNPTANICDLCESWEVSEDGLTYIFQIRDARWHDGKPVTAEDIVFSLDRIVQPGEKRTRTSSLRSFYEHKTAQVIDEKTVKMPIKNSGSTFLPILGSEAMKMYPKHVAENLSVEDANCCPENLIGSGPWALKEYKRTISIEYERNSDYFKPDRPFFDGLMYVRIPTVPSLYAALQVGQVHATIGYSSAYKRRDVIPLQKDTEGRLKADYVPTFGGVGFVLTNRPPFDDPRVRRAFYLGIDRQNILDIIYHTDEFGYGGRLADFYTMRALGVEDEKLEGLPGYRVPKDQDITEAKALLAAAGYPDGFETELNTGKSKTSIAILEVITEGLRKDLGIDLVLRPVDTAAYHARQNEGTYPISFAGGAIQMIIDPSDNLQYSFDLDTAGNPDNVTYPELAKLLETQASEADQSKRIAALKEILPILRNGETHWVPTIWRDMGMLYDYRLQNWRTPLSGELNLKWEHVWWDEDAPLPSK